MVCPTGQTIGDSCQKGEQVWRRLETCSSRTPVGRPVPPLLVCRFVGRTGGFVGRGGRFVGGGDRGGLLFVDLGFLGLLLRRLGLVVGVGRKRFGPLSRGGGCRAGGRRRCRGGSAGCGRVGA